MSNTQPGQFSFTDIMHQVERQMQQDPNAFGFEPEMRKKVIVTNVEGILGRPLNRIEEKMLRNIMNMDAHSWARGKNGGLISGLQSFDDAFEGGAQPGLILFAAAPNVGKSAYMLQVCKGISERNEKVYVSYHSLDDANNDLMPRYIANDQQITIGQAKSPAKYEDDEEIINKRNEGIKNLYRRVDRFGMFDSNDMTSVEAIEEHIKDIKMTMPEGTRIVIAIDSFNDLTVESKTFSNNDDKTAHVSKTIKGWATRFDVVVMCTAHLRKTNGKRPIEDDLKDTITLRYEATMVCLMYNEVGIKEENAEIYWVDEDEDLKMPVVEVKFAKNKHASMKSTKFFNFIPDYSLFIQAEDEAQRRFASKIYQN
ncbi:MULTISPECIES: DnaB-like helicase C-terminal domain-containing protein [Paenibacillus]|uniref:DnaB-like helicase C-terminal domain-containing protein n=1 Tax=Paenibacillus urinalis TaxID=521520 RepID=A0ABY7XJW1_9BACL|nr:MULTISPECIES: DnaB-like helicase C-terminal domain-containing protein [Paenibacillus]WDI05084.1 DnaB-like helicase C-terminal domain-containing protein [Paenibacillus urinalis]